MFPEFPVIIVFLLVKIFLMALEMQQCPFFQRSDFQLLSKLMGILLSFADEFQLLNLFLGNLVEAKLVVGDALLSIDDLMVLVVGL